VEKSDVESIKLPTQEIRGTPNRHRREEKRDIRVDQHVVRFPTKS